MNKTEASRYVENVRGVIIGDQWKTGELFHEGRSQSQQFIGANDAEVKTKAIAHVETMKARLGADYRRLYPNGLELRIWD